MGEPQFKSEPVGPKKGVWAVYFVDPDRVTLEMIQRPRTLRSAGAQSRRPAQHTGKPTPVRESAQKVAPYSPTHDCLSRLRTTGQRPGWPRSPVIFASRADLAGVGGGAGQIAAP